jgi:glyoxylase-like metal-dependent hydrolase (beta-lactamase superfamily II)
VLDKLPETPGPQKILPQPHRITIDDDWFEVQKIGDYLYAISEPRHYEHTVLNLLIGDKHAILIDTGCGIGNLRRAVELLTSHPVTVINTHTHLDHLGSNSQFSNIMMFDHPRSRGVSRDGVPQETLFWELLNEKVVTPPWPRGFERQKAALPPFEVSRWLKHGDVVEIGGIRLKVLHTPGEAADHICLLDQTHRILFCGDILLNGAVWSHLDGGDVRALRASYELLMRHYDEFDFLMPGHNAPCQSKDLLPIALAGAEDVLSGKVRSEDGIDPWGRQYKKYNFGPISILTK